MLHSIQIKYNLYGVKSEFTGLGDVILFGDVLEIEHSGKVKISTRVRDIIYLRIDNNVLDRPFPKNVEALLDSCSYPSYKGQIPNKIGHSCTIRFFRSCQECCQTFSSVMFTANPENLTIRDFRFASNMFRYDEILEMSIDGEILDIDEYDYEKMERVLKNLEVR